MTAAGPVHEDPFLKGNSENGKSRVLQFGFYILSSVGLENLLNAEIHHFPFAVLSLSSNNSEDEVVGKKRKSPKIKKKHKTNKENKRRSSNKRSRRRPLPDSSKEQYEKLLEKTSLTLSVNESNNESYTFHDGVLELLQRALRFLAEARTCSPQQLVSRILFSLAETLSETFDQPNQKDLERAVSEAVRQAQESCGNCGHVAITPTICLDRSVSGLIVSYNEHDEYALPRSKQAWVKRGMHFDIPLKRFDATVKYPTEVPRHLRVMENGNKRKRHKNKQDRIEANQQIMDFVEEQDKICRMLIDEEVAEHPPCSPQSFPPTPVSRNEVMSHFREHTQNVLYRVRDELRGEQEHNDRARIATFDIEDTHDDMVLSKGGHCCSTHDKLSSFCSTRAILPIQYDIRTATYIEFEIKSPPINCRNFSPKVCIGLSTKKLPLSCLTGSARCSIGINTSGRILKEGQCINAIYKSNEKVSIKPKDIVGVCSKLSNYDQKKKIFRLSVAFFINGKRVFGETSIEEGSADGFSLSLSKSVTNIYPTVTIYSQDTTVTCRFVAQDLVHYGRGSPKKNELSKNFWNEINEFADGNQILGLDGNPVY